MKKESGRFIIEMKLRLKTEARKLSVIFAVGLLYYLWVVLTDIRIPCVFNLATGLLCPGCGITRMIVSASGLDFAAAYAYNKLLFVTWPLLLALLVYYEWNYIKNGVRDIGRMNIFLWIEAAMLLVFGVVRNLI